MTSQRVSLGPELHHRCRASEETHILTQTRGQRGGRRSHSTSRDGLYLADPAAPAPLSQSTALLTQHTGTSGAPQSLWPKVTSASYSKGLTRAPAKSRLRGCCSLS